MIGPNGYWIVVNQYGMPLLHSLASSENLSWIRAMSGRDYVKREAGYRAIRVQMMEIE